MTTGLLAALEKMYDQSLASNNAYLMKRLFNLTMTDFDVVVKYLNEFNFIVKQLESIGIKFDDEISALTLMSSLPNSWSALVVAIALGIVKLKLKDVASVLLREESYQRMTSEGSTTELH
ncbi:hypothetical protein U1Q18_052740 [Sarracenia purpurea var. burkii]